MKAYIEERAVGIADYSIKNSHIWLFFLSIWLKDVILMVGYRGTTAEIKKIRGGF